MILYTPVEVKLALDDDSFVVEFFACRFSSNKFSKNFDGISHKAKIHEHIND
jgi:hypothetical protein